jgi:hypothetical protein
VASLAILIGSEVFGIAIASGWAIAGILELGDVVALGLEAALFALGLAAMGWFVKQALEVEPAFTSDRN